MCYNFETSISTFIFALVSSIYLWNRNKSDDRWISIFGMTFSSMQLVEALLHKNLSNRNINRLLYIAGFTIIFLQPLANNLGGVLYSNNKSFFIQTTILYLLFALYIFIFKFPNEDEQQTTQKYNLQWNWLRKINYYDWGIFLFFLGIPCLLYNDSKKSIFCFLIGAFAFLYAYFYAGFRQTGSLWCILVNLMYIGVILLN